MGLFVLLCLVAVLKFKRKSFSWKFIPVLMSKHRYLVCFGGRGSGKTRHIILKLVALTYMEKHVSVLYCRHQFETLRKTTFKDICNFMKNTSYGEDFVFSEAPNGSMTFTNKITGNQLVPVGLDDEEKTKGLSEATHAWIDEVDKCTIEQYSMLNSVLRTQIGPYLQMIVSFNPVAETHWLRKTFFHPDNAYAPNPEYGDKLMVHHSTARDNEYIDVVDYIGNLSLTYAGNTSALDVNVKGLWGVEDNKNPWLYNFKYDKHVSKVPIPYLKGFPIYLSFDFNRDPVTASCWQMSPNFNVERPFIHCFDCFEGQVQLSDLCQMIKAKYPAAIFYVTGDSSGNKGDVTYNSAHDTAYNLIKKYLELSKVQMNQNISNLQHENSRLLCNALFYHFPNILISNTCTTLVHDCQIAKIDENSRLLHHLLKDRGIYKMDMFDNMRYFFQRYLYEYVKVNYLKLVKE